MFIIMSQVNEIMQQIGNSQGKALPWGTVNVQYGLVNDRICLRAAGEGVHLFLCPGVYG